MLANDDELGAVSNDYLGPAGYTFPWRARYSAYGVAVALTAVAFAVVHRFHVPVNLFTVAWCGLIVVAVTRKVGQWVSFETPLRALLVTFWHELTAPRPSRKPASVVLRPGRVRVSDADGRPVCRGCPSCVAAP